MKRFAVILIAGAAVAAALLPAASWADTKPPAKGDVARQILLKQAIDKLTKGTLVAELNQNKAVWAAHTPEQLQELRNRYYAYLKESPDKQAALLQAAADIEKLDPQQRQAYLDRAQWLQKVVAALTAEQREELKNLSPADRAKRLLELKAELLDTPTTTSAPTTKLP
jgi:hypothetical protein